MSLNLNPKTLYRYYSNINYAIQLISKRELFFSSPNAFNDPYDFFPSIKGIDAYAEILCKIKGIEKSEYKKTIKEWRHENKLKLINKLKTNFKVCCFTENFDNIRMWSYYTNGFQGCCIGFSTDELRNPSNKMDFIFKVQYVSQRPKFTDMKGKDRLKQIAILAAKKNQEYKDEKEWRCVKYLNNEDLDLSCPENGIIKIDRKIIKEVILGSKMSAENIKKIRVLARQEKIKVFQIKNYSAKNDFKLIKGKSIIVDI